MGKIYHFLEVEIRPGAGIKTHMGEDSQELIDYLKEQGIDYTFEIEFCG